MERASKAIARPNTASSPYLLLSAPFRKVRNVVSAVPSIDKTIAIHVVGSAPFLDKYSIVFKGHVVQPAVDVTSDGILETATRLVGSDPILI